jgi:hypothetical protein
MIYENSTARMAMHAYGDHMRWTARAGCKVERAQAREKKVDRRTFATLRATSFLSVTLLARMSAMVISEHAPSNCDVCFTPENGH